MVVINRFDKPRSSVRETETTIQQLPMVDPNFEIAPQEAQNFIRPSDDQQLRSKVSVENLGVLRIIQITKTKLLIISNKNTKTSKKRKPHSWFHTLKSTS